MVALPPAAPLHGARVAVFVVAAASAVIAYVLYSAPNWVVDLFPWPEAPMSFVFLASIAASVGAVWLTIALMDEPAALAGVGVNVIVASFGAFLLLLYQVWVVGRGDLVLGAVGSGISAVFGVWLWYWARRIPVRDPRPMAAIVRWAFIFFIVALVIAGSALVLQHQVFPWTVWGQTAVLFGSIFLGAAAYFAHAVVRGRWAFAAPALAGFLAYDIVLFVPYFKLLFADTGNVSYGGGPVNRVSLVIFLSVLTVSALLALYTALLHPSTRLGAARAARRA